MPSATLIKVPSLIIMRAIRWSNFKSRRFLEAISANADGALEAHDLRTRSAGRATFIEFHLVVPGSMSVERAHEICDRIEAALRSGVEHPVITIHVEPANKAKHEGIVVL